MTTHRVVIQPRARADIARAYRWLAARDAAAAARWYNGLTAAILSLESHPERCGVAPESEHVPREVRQLPHGKRRNVYRILFAVEGDTVSVLAVRHAAQDFLSPEELE